MQYKKKDINDRILEAGRNEYAEKGYRAGNISTIAANSGVPVGNLYRYFDGKAGLLDAIVKPAYTEIPKAVTELSRMDEVSNLSLEELVPMLTDQLLKIFDKYGKEILILVDKCATTRYEDFSDNLYRLVDELICKKIYPIPTENDKLMSEIIAKAFITSMFDVLRTNPDREKMQTMVNKILLFFFFDVYKRC